MDPSAMPKPRLPKPTPAELGLLRTLWQLGPSSVRQVHETQRRERPDLAYAPVLRLMQVMHGKGLLKRDESQRSHVYAPTQAQGSLQTRLLDDLIHKAFAGSGKDLVLAALRGGRVSDAEREEIQRFLGENHDD
jgi:predicted transcriptional regulator